MELGRFTYCAEHWLRPRKTSSKQLTVIRKLLWRTPLKCSRRGPDREGQLLVDEVIDYCKVSKAKSRWKGCWLVIWTYQPWSVHFLKCAAIATLSLFLFQHWPRSRADWLYGMNMTRAYTLLGQKPGYQGVLSVKACADTSTWFGGETWWRDWKLHSKVILCMPWFATK